ncbi:hypothetical protein [Sediminispirochaeta bajacaliforniensis]|uniref:hypothetical protein n=1 Tax=Sediminispirochaeta bajacaliforniensis TaxID=148 RepID=UPI0012B62AFE|nr:hypothetical protein [Sediminispirochaeta bajacaliforniensis]
MSRCLSTRDVQQGKYILKIAGCLLACAFMVRPPLFADSQVSICPAFSLQVYGNRETSGREGLDKSGISIGVDTPLFPLPFGERGGVSASLVSYFDRVHSRNIEGSEEYLLHHMSASIGAVLGYSEGIMLLSRLGLEYLWDRDLEPLGEAGAIFLMGLISLPLSDFSTQWGVVYSENFEYPLLPIVGISKEWENGLIVSLLFLFRFSFTYPLSKRLRLSVNAINSSTLTVVKAESSDGVVDTEALNLAQFLIGPMLSYDTGGELSFELEGGLELRRRLDTSADLDPAFYGRLTVKIKTCRALPAG